MNPDSEVSKTSDERWQRSQGVSVKSSHFGTGHLYLEERKGRKQMKKKVLAVVVLAALTVVLMTGSVSAGQMPDVDMASLDLSDAAYPPLCLDIVGACNDVELIYTPLNLEIMHVVGHEYGCGYSDRNLHGVARVEGNTVHISWTIHATLSSIGVPQLGQRSVQLDLTSLSGPYQYAYHYDTYHYGSGTANVVTCPATAVDAGGLDESQGP